MTKLPPHLVILILVLSCNIGEQTQPKEVTVVKFHKPKISESPKIRFDFTAGRINTFRETIEIKASLYNDNTDTVSFLTSTCDGEQYSLRYDTTRFILTPYINCNASYPRLERIPPKGHYDFQAHFRVRTSETKIKLGFDFYQVDKAIDLKKFSLINIHDRQSDDQNILWANEKTIQ